jgi:hypothetical protein
MTIKPIMTRSLACDAPHATDRVSRDVRAWRDTHQADRQQVVGVHLVTGRYAPLF